MSMAALGTALDATLSCAEYNGDIFITAAGSADERKEMASELGKLAIACHAATGEKEDIVSEPIALQAWPDDDVRPQMQPTCRPTSCCYKHEHKHAPCMRKRIFFSSF